VKLRLIIRFQYSLCLLIFFLLEMGIAIMGFVFPHTMQSLLEENFTDKIIHTYRDDPDLQNFIDFAQQEVTPSLRFSLTIY
jgi:tetraspanin-33